MRPFCFTRYQDLSALSPPRCLPVKAHGQQHLAPVRIFHPNHSLQYFVTDQLDHATYRLT